MTTTQPAALQPTSIASWFLAWGGWSFLPVYTSYVDLLGNAHPGAG